MATYQQHLSSYFGGDPKKYAEEIKKKRAAGIALSDPGAAKAFEKDYPQYFTASGGGTGSSGSSIGEKRKAKYPTAYLYLGNEKIPVTMKEDRGYIDGRRITELYPNIKWTPTSEAQPGGAWGYYTLDQPPKPQVPPEPQASRFMDKLIREITQPVPYQRPEFNVIYNEVLRSKRDLVEKRKQEAREEFEKGTLPQLRANLAQSGYLHSDRRFQLEQQARESLEKVLSGIELEAQGDAYEEALKRYGMDADIAKTMADNVFRQRGLALQLGGLLEQQQYHQGLLRQAGEELGLEREKFGWAKDIEGQKFGLEQEKLDWAKRGDLVNQLLQITGLMGNVPQIGGVYADLAAALGLTPGEKTAQMQIAQADQELRRILGLSGAGRGGGGGGFAPPDLPELSGQYIQIMETAYDRMMGARNPKEVDEVVKDITRSLTTSDMSGLLSPGELERGINTVNWLKSERLNDFKRPKGDQGGFLGDLGDFLDTLFSWPPGRKYKEKYQKK